MGLSLSGAPVYHQHGVLWKIPSVHMLLLAIELTSRNLWFKPVMSVGGFGQPARYAKTNEEDVCFLLLVWGEWGEVVWGTPG